MHSANNPSLLLVIKATITLKCDTCLGGSCRNAIARWRTKNGYQMAKNIVRLHNIFLDAMINVGFIGVRVLMRHNSWA